MFRRRGQQAITHAAPGRTGPAQNAASAGAAAAVVYPMPQADQVDAVHGPATEGDTDGDSDEE